MDDLIKNDSNRMCHGWPNRGSSKNWIFISMHCKV